MSQTRFREHHKIFPVGRYSPYCLSNDEQERQKVISTWIRYQIPTMLFIFCFYYWDLWQQKNSVLNEETICKQRNHRHHWYTYWTLSQQSMAFIALKDYKLMTRIQTHWSEVLNTLYDRLFLKMGYFCSTYTKVSWSPNAFFCWCDCRPVLTLRGKQFILAQ